MLYFMLNNMLLFKEGGVTVPSYQKMYRIMLKAASEAAESLDIYERLVADQTRKLREALREAEELCKSSESAEDA